MNLFSEEILKLIFYNPDFQKRWQSHILAFGKIIEPAFINDYQSKIDLMSVLDNIREQNFSESLQHLEELQKRCLTKEEYALIYFCAGLIYEMQGRRHEMADFYQEANKYEHKFYLPYLKVAKYYHEHHSYENAKENYCKSLECFNNTSPDNRERVMISSIYTNLASACLMMHNYKEAEQALVISEQLCPKAGGRASVEVMLYAIQEETELVEDCLKELENNLEAEAFEVIRESVLKIQEKRHPWFFPVPVEEERLQSFWKWFQEYWEFLKTGRESGEEEKKESVRELLAKRLLLEFPFFEEPPILYVKEGEGRLLVEFIDIYAISIRVVYQQLLKTMPEKLKEDWEFVIK